MVKANTTSPKPAPANYQEDQPDNIVGYNSIRVPWHMGTDALENGSSGGVLSIGRAEGVELPRRRSPAACRRTSTRT